MASPIKKNAQVLGSVVVFYLIVVIQAHFAIGKKHAFKKEPLLHLRQPSVLDGILSQISNYFVCFFQNFS